MKTDFASDSGLHMVKIHSAKFKVCKSVPFGFFTIGKSDRSVRSDSNTRQFLRIITI